MFAALGTRVKYLVDTPELIWGCLDTREFLAAAQRLARASVVHNCLMRSGQRAMVERRFPLIGHLWPNVEKFRCFPTVFIYSAGSCLTCLHPAAYACSTCLGCTQCPSGLSVMKQYSTSPTVAGVAACSTAVH